VQGDAVRTYLVDDERGIMAEASDRVTVEDLRTAAKMDGRILDQRELTNAGLVLLLDAWVARTDRRYFVRSPLATTSGKGYVVCVMDPKAAASWESVIGTCIAEADAELAYPLEMDAWQHGDDTAADADLDLLGLDVELDSFGFPDQGLSP
jgi:hypothetical protein